MQKVTVIIPAYNCQNTIRTTINSVLNQTYPKEYLEVIIVNDGSTDDTPEIIDSYGENFKIIHTENRGVSHARNKGLEYATGEFIQYLDSDDILITDKIQKQVTALIENDGDVAYGNWQKFKEVENSIQITETVIKKIEGNHKISIFIDFWCPPAAILYSRRIVEKIGLWKEWLPIIQDARYLLDAALENGKFVYTNLNVALYREGNPNSLSQRELEFVKDCYHNAIDLSKIWEVEESKNESLEKDAIITCISTCINGFSTLSNDYFREATDYLLKIQPKYIPKKRGLLRLTALLLGYRSAEKIARYKRKFIQ
jgi:glycosyltransferase involved in cell wall biosynthesis